MGSGSFAVTSFVIGYDDLKKIVPDQIDAIENEKFFDHIGWGTIGQWLGWDDIAYLEDAILDNYYDDSRDDDYNQKVAEVAVQRYVDHINNLQTAFNEKTGLTLYFDHYNEEDGDRYDDPNDKDGIIFCVGGMMVLSPAGENFKDIVTERRWTQFG